MRRVSTLRAVSFGLLIVGCSSAYGASLAWPLKGPIELSSGFGDFRPGRFHAGLDLRTGGEVGKDVFSPVDGYVLRVKMSYYGYGKGLYVKGDDGHIYVFGHLSAFESGLDHRIKELQMAAKRYYLEVEFPADSLRVRKGQLLAQSGQTGAGAPHLHLEQRTADNFPIDPLTHGFKLSDKVKPTITRIGFQLVDDHSLFDDGTRQVFADIMPSKKDGQYTLRPVLYFNTPFGMLLDCIDRSAPDGMKQAVYKISVSIDGRPYYEVVLDTLDFATGRAADLEYDYAQVVSNKSDARRLYRTPGDDFAGSRAFDSGNGVFGPGPGASYGPHQVRITASDAAGNISELSFEFIWGPPGDLFRLDSTRTVNDSTMNFFFTPAVDWSGFGIDSLGVQGNKMKFWGTSTVSKVRRQPDGRLIASVVGRAVDRVPLRLVAYTKGNGAFVGNAFCGLAPAGTSHIKVEGGVMDGGIVATTDCNTGRASRCRYELYYRGRLLGTELPERFFNVEQYRCFIPPRPEYARIDAIASMLNLDTTQHVFAFDSSANYFLVGRDSVEDVSIDTFFTLHAGRRNFFKPMYLCLKSVPITNKGMLKMVSDCYQILPPELATRQDIDATLRPNVISDVLGKSGLCRYDESGQRWIWLGGMGPDSLLHGRISTGGSYAAILDIEPPTIEKLSLNDSEVIPIPRPIIKFTLQDDLSGLEDDRNIVIKLDGKWMIPEYDPETGICQTQPLDSLAAGEHHLSIEVKDRAGNEAQRYLKFRVVTRIQTPRKQK
jgi:hypothetical protein